jgi:hypothetical protein
MRVPSHEQRECIRLDKKKRNQGHRQSNNIEQRWRTEKNIDMLNECVKKKEAFLSIMLSEGNRW